MTKWKKKDKENKEKKTAMASFEKHLKEMEQQKTQLPPVQIRRERDGTGSNDLILDNISMTIGGKTLL